MSLSPMLEFMVSRLEGLSTNTLRLEVQNQSSNITPQSIIRVTLPQNALLSIPSLAWHFNCVTSGQAGAGQTRLPNGIDHIINRVSVSIGGQDVASGANFYNVLSKCREVLEGSRLDAGLEHPEIITTGANNSYVSGAAADVSGNETYPSANNEAQFCVRRWNGFLDSCEPKVLSTDLVSDIVVTIFLEQASLAVVAADGVAAATFVANTSAQVPSYTVNNMYFTVKAYSMANGVLDNLYAEQMSQGNLELTFKQYFSFRDTTASTMRYSVASQSINKVIVAHHENASPAVADQHPILAAGYNPIASNLADRVLNLGKAKYIVPYTNFSVPTSSGVPLFEWQMNGAKYPMYRATPEDLLLIARQGNGAKADLFNKDMGLHQYKTNNFVSCMDLTLDAPSSRFLQGVDSRSTSLSAYYNMFNVTANKTLTLFVECGSSLFIAPGKQVAVVQ